MRKNSQKLWSLAHWRSPQAASLSVTHATWVIVAVAVSALTVTAVAVPSSPVHKWISCNIGQISLISSKTALPNACQVSSAATPAPILAGSGSSIAIDPMLPFAMDVTSPTGMTITNTGSGLTGSLSWSPTAGTTVSAIASLTTLSGTGTTSSSAITGSVRMSGSGNTNSGSVGGTAIVGGTGNTIAGTVSGSALLLGASADLSSAATVDGPLLLAVGQNATINAAIPGSTTVILTGNGETFQLASAALNAPLIVAGSGDTIGSPSSPVRANDGITVVGSHDTIYADVQGEVDATGDAAVIAGVGNTFSGAVNGNVEEGQGSLGSGIVMVNGATTVAPIASSALDLILSESAGSIAISVP